jgi:carbonic anhydrase/acetyltransferase-like protein (isoleucine patch superfamily)
MEVKKVLLRADGVKYIIIPRNSNLQKGDVVKITKIEEDEIKRK